MGSTHENRRKAGIHGQWSTVNDWSIKGPLLLLGLVAGVLAGAYNWDTAPFAAGVAIILPIFGFRALWNQSRFWITVLILAAGQVPLVLAAHSVVTRLSFPLMLVFGISDCVLIIFVIYTICLRSEQAE